MTQDADRSHRRDPAVRYAVACVQGRPMSNGHSTPPADYSTPPASHHALPADCSTPPAGHHALPADYSTPPAGDHALPAGHHAPQFVPTSWSQPQYRAVRHPGAQQFVPHPRNPVAPPPSGPFVMQPPDPTPAERSNGFATAGLAVAVIAAVLSIIPIIGTVAWIVAPIALVLSALGLVTSGRARSGRRASVVGVVLAVLALVMCVVCAVGVAGAVATAQQQSTAVHHVTYKVTTAKGTRIAATYSQSRDDNLALASVTGAGSPWTANAQVSGFMGATVSASLSLDAGRMIRSDTITCTIIEDGVQVAHEYADGPGASVTCTR